MNLDDSIFENDQDSEIEGGKEEQTQVEPIKWTLHNGPPTRSFDREIQVHQEQQDNSSSQKASENYSSFSLVYPEHKMLRLLFFSFLIQMFFQYILSRFFFGKIL